MGEVVLLHNIQKKLFQHHILQRTDLEIILHETNINSLNFNKKKQIRFEDNYQTKIISVKIMNLILKFTFVDKFY